MPPEFFRPAGPERRSRPEFEQRLYQTAISAKLSAEWQTGPGISPRKAGCKVLFCQKRRGDQGTEDGRIFAERQTDGTAAERHGKQLPQTRRPGFRGYKSRGPDRTAAERGAARRRGTGDATGDEQRAAGYGQRAARDGQWAARDRQWATDNKRQALDDGRRNERRTTSGGRWTMNGKTRNDRKKPDGIQTKEDGPTKLARCGLRETRAEGDTGRQEKDGRREERRGKERCGEDRQDSGVRRQKKTGLRNRRPDDTARRAGIQYLFLLAQNTHRNVENRRIVQRNHASVRPRLEVDTHAFFRLVLASEIVADSVYIDS